MNELKVKSSQDNQQKFERVVCSLFFIRFFDEEDTLVSCEEEREKADLLWNFGAQWKGTCHVDVGWIESLMNRVI